MLRSLHVAHPRMPREPSGCWHCPWSTVQSSVTCGGHNSMEVWSNLGFSHSTIIKSLWNTDVQSKSSSHTRKLSPSHSDNPEISLSIAQDSLEPRWFRGSLWTEDIFHNEMKDASKPSVVTRIPALRRLRQEELKFKASMGPIEIFHQEREKGKKRGESEEGKKGWRNGLKEGGKGKDTMWFLLTGLNWDTNSSTLIQYRDISNNYIIFYKLSNLILSMKTRLQNV